MNKTTVKGNRKKIKHGLICLAVIIYIPLMSKSCIDGSKKDSDYYQSLRQNGVTTKALVAAESVSGNSRHKYYHYKLCDARNHEWQYTGGIYGESENLAIGSLVSVTYLPDNIQTYYVGKLPSIEEDQSTIKSRIVIIIIALTVSLLCAIYLVRIIISISTKSPKEPIYYG